MPLDLTLPEFRALVRRAEELTAAYLERLETRDVIPQTSGVESQRLFSSAPSERGEGAAVLDSIEQVFAHSRANNGRFFAYVLGSGEPVAAVGDFLASVLNQNVTAWRSSPAAAIIERTVVRWLGEAIGCHGFTGSLTGGGSSANTMALAMARESLAPANETGALAGCTLYASQEVHMSVPKAVALLGLGRANLRLLPVDDNYRMVPAALQAAIELDIAQGKRPLCVIASAGTVNTGAIDPLDEIGVIARRHGAWFHIDGAYGALAAIAAPEKFRGLASADSLSLDAHKWLYQPLDCGCLLFRDPTAARRAFAHTGDYARSMSDDPIEGFAFFEESMELSRRFRALKLWLSLRYHGLAEFRRAIAGNLKQARTLVQLIGQTSELELLAPVELSAVCFGWKNVGGRDRDKLNQEILRQVSRRGRVAISNATLKSGFALRACIVNHRTQDGDLETLIAEVLAAGREALAGR